MITRDLRRRMDRLDPRRKPPPFAVIIMGDTETQEQALERFRREHPDHLPDPLPADSCIIWVFGAKNLPMTTGDMNE